MMRYVVLSVLVLVLGSSAKAEAPCKLSPCVKVDIYYESLCPDSLRFIKNQLGPSYQGLKHHLNLNWVPYGNANTKDASGKWVFTCQHGPSECRNNKEHACVLDVIGNISEGDFEIKQFLAATIIGCSMIHPNVEILQCIGNSEEIKDKIRACIGSSRADDLLAAYGDKTHNVQPPISFIPTIVLDNVYSTANQNAALVNFKKLICDRIPDADKPNICGR